MRKSSLHRMAASYNAAGELDRCQECGKPKHGFIGRASQAHIGRVSGTHYRQGDQLNILDSQLCACRMKVVRG